jgi:hypothetical protein
MPFQSLILDLSRAQFAGPVRSNPRMFLTEKFDDSAVYLPRAEVVFWCAENAFKFFFCDCVAQSLYAMFDIYCIFF